MKTKLIILICFAVGFLPACKDEMLSQQNRFESTGMILGSDKGQCICCGGWILTIDNDENEYRIEELPADSDIELNEQNLSVKFNWSIDRACLSYTYIDIEAIELN